MNIGSRDIHPIDMPLSFWHGIGVHVPSHADQFYEANEVYEADEDADAGSAYHPASLFSH